MSQSITITDHDYSLWVKQLSKRFRQSQIQSAVRVNQEMLRYYWELGRDIVALNAENKYGRGFYTNLSRDLRQSIPEVTCFSETSIRYAKRFFELYKMQIPPTHSRLLKSWRQTCSLYLGDITNTS